MKKAIKKKVSIPLLALDAVLVAGLVVGNYYASKYAPVITTYLGQKNYTIQESDSEEDTEYFKSVFASSEERLLADEAAERATAAEGIVLLKNDGAALPLERGQKVTLFGVASADILYGGGGSGAVDTTTAPTMKSALEQTGFTVNPVLWDFYTEGAAKDIRMDVADISGTGRYVIHEASPELFSETETTSFAEYSDAAVVVFARSGSESSDIPTVYDESYLEDADIEGYYGSVHSDGLDSPEDVGRHYLQLTKNEEDLLAYVSGQFDKVIVVINSGNAMQLSFLDEEAYGVDACLWIGNPGQDGLYALGDILNGTTSPSGKTVDTYAYNPLGAPAVQNFGDNHMTNADEAISDTYVVYQEGIYVGYRYYETRYEDTVLGQGSADAAVGVTAEGASSWSYDAEVQFPFGYGLSYTTFSHKLLSSDKTDDTFTFTIEVTNTGDVEGKDVVELYAQSPYTEYDKANGVEKASVTLCGFAKTSNLEPGASETVTITVQESALVSYDANNAKTYILEGGTYYFAAATDAHDAVNIILAAKGATGMDEEADTSLCASFELSESDAYAVSAYTGVAITNQFDDADIRSLDDSFVYLTRSDWAGTFPTETYAFTATPEIVEALAVKTAEGDPDAEMPTTGASNGLTLAMMREVDAEDSSWDDLLDQLTAEEMYTLVRVGGYQTQAVNSVSAPATVDVDGPAYVGNAGTTGVNVAEKTYAWCSEVVIASTWNTEMAQNMGSLIGEDCLAQGELNFAGWYAPAMNIHRTAFSGRNFEYYSEDGFLSGEMGAATVRGARSRGVITYVKHFVLNDQETNRINLATFANEQSIRELYLKAFEASIADNGEDTNTLGVMASMNRIGLTWSGNHKGLMQTVLRDEWGYDGVMITDQASYPAAFPMLAIEPGLECGIDLWLNSGTDNWQIEGYQSNAATMTNLREASRHILYAVSRSLAMNGISSSTTVVSTLAMWQYALIALDVVVGVLAIAAAILLVRRTSWKGQ